MYLIASPLLIKNSAFKDKNSSKTREIRELALSVLNLLILKDAESGVFDNEPLSGIDFNVYEQSFAYEEQTVYCNSKSWLLSSINDFL